MNIKTVFLTFLALLMLSTSAMGAGRALLPMGNLQGSAAGYGYYSPGAPYFNKERVPEGSTIEEYQKGRENDVGKYFDDWNTSLAGPEAHEPGYKSGYEANGGNKLGEMLNQARGAIQKDGSIRMVPPKKAETFDISGEVSLNQIRAPNNY